MGTSTTFNPSGITTALREDLEDTIYNIAPTDTVFMSNIGKIKINSRYHEWLIDTLTTAASNAVTEGNDAVPADIVAQTRTGNYVQTSAKWFKISDILEKINKAGRKSEIAYQTALKLKELARDMEYALLNNSSAVTTDPRSLCGLKGWISTNQINFTTGTTSTTLTETYFNDSIQRCWTQGGNPDMVLAPAKQKRLISAFDGNSRLTVNMEADDKKVINTVDLYESDFGVVKVYASRFLATDDDTTYESVFILEKDKFALGVLQPVKVEKLAKTGLAQTVQIATTYTLISKQEAASDWIKNCYNG